MNEIILPLALSFFAGISTVIGGVLVVLKTDFRKSYLSFFLGISAGTMIYLSFIELMPRAIATVGFQTANLAFFFGILLIGVIDRVVPHHYVNYCERKGIKYDKLALTGYMVALGIVIHNFPEGIAVFMSTLGDVRYGVMIALATALHNIPEGIAVAAPLYYATKNKKKALKHSFLAGIAEPLGAIAAYVVLRPFITPNFLAYVFAVVAGIMVYISLDELLPTCFEHSHGHRAIAGIVFGMLVIAISLNYV